MSFSICFDNNCDKEQDPPISVLVGPLHKETGLSKR